MPSPTLHQESENRIRRNSGVVYRAASAGILLVLLVLVLVWFQNHREVPDGGAVAGKWRNSTAYYLVEPMDALSPDDPCEQVVIIKPAQSGGSAVAENWLGFIMHRTPGPAMYVGPTVIAAKDWFEEKLQPTIEATPVLAPS